MMEDNNKTLLSAIPGGFAVMPNALIGFISDRACTVFLKLYQCQFILDREESEDEKTDFLTKISIKYLATSLGKSKNTIAQALDELSGMHLVILDTENRKNMYYSIDWNEVIFVCNMLCKVDNVGRDKLQKLCVQSKFDRMSSIDSTVLSEIVEQHPSKTRFGQKMTEHKIIGSKSDRIITVQSNIDRINDTLGQKMTEPENIRSKNDRTDIDDDNYEIGSKNDRKNDDSDLRFGQKMTEKTEIRSDFDRNESGFGQILTTDIYNIYNKKDSSERSSQYKGEKEKFFLDYFSSRDLSLPGFDKLLLESFLEQALDEDDDDTVKTIKYIWGQLDYDDEFPDNNFIELEVFRNILYHSWVQLKEQFPDYGLSEQDIKNIFGFLVIQHEGVDCLYIDPSKIQDIKATPREPVRRTSQVFKYSDRMSRRLFIECIDEIAKDDDRLLTTAEFSALLLIDYAEDNKRGSYAVEIPKMMYSQVLKDISEKAIIPEDDLRELFKELPQKGMVRISPQQLLPDKFFKYNQDHNQESKVEELFKRKLAEQE